MIESEARRCMKCSCFVRYQDKYSTQTRPNIKRCTRFSLFDTFVTHFLEFFLESQNGRTDTKITELID